MAVPKEYEHISFTFNQASGVRNGKSLAVTAYLLVPDDVMPELRQWEQEAAQQQKTVTPSSAHCMFETLIQKGALLHRADGPAYEEIERSAFDPDHSEVIVSEFWEKGVFQSRTGKPEPEPVTPQTIKSLGKYVM